MIFNIRKTIISLASSLVILVIAALTLRTTSAQPARLPDAPSEPQTITGSSTPVSVTNDKDGYTVWTYEYPGSWCVMYSRIRWPFDLGQHDPSDLSQASLRLTFAEQPYRFGPEGEWLYSDSTWGVALNGKPGPWSDGTFTGDWNLIGAIGTTPSYPYKVFVEQEVPFDYTELIDGENNLWFQQQDSCYCSNMEDCACTCYELARLQLRAKVKLGVKDQFPTPGARNIWYDQEAVDNADPIIRVRFTTMVSETTVNENTFQVSYLTEVNNKPERVYVPGHPRKLSDLEYTFIPDAPLKDGIRYEVRVWGKNDVSDESHDGWVQDIVGGPLEDGAHWSFWTLPELQVRLEPVQVLEDEPLVVYKPTVLRVFLSSKNFYPDVWYKDLWEYVDVDDITLAWRSPSGTQEGTASWRADASNWHFGYTPENARRARLYDKSQRLASLDAVDYYGFVPEESGGYYWLNATVTVLDQNGELHKFHDLVMPNVVQAPWLTLHARALAVGSDYGKSGTANLSSVALGHRSGVQALYPVPNVRLVQPASAIPYYQIVTRQYGLASFLMDWEAEPAGTYYLMESLAQMNALCLASSGCDMMIGYVPGAWLDMPGLTAPKQVWYGMLVQSDGYSDPFRYIVAHEAGHLSGFEHDTREGGQGYDVRRRTDRRISTAWLNPHGQKTLNTIHSFMNIDPVESPPPERLWIEWRNYDALLTRLTTASQIVQQTTLADPLLLATGIITPTTGDIQLDPWYLLEPGEFETPPAGPYRLVFLDGGGQEIAGYTRAFSSSTTLQPASGDGWNLPPDAPTPFMLKVPYPAATARIQIRRNSDDVLLAERTVSASVPGITITPPVSTTWTGPQPIAWETDPGETRHYLVQVSTDNGATWEAQAIYWPGTVYTLETASMLNTTQAFVRVLATDGLNTASDTAGPFTIDNPLGVDYVSPMPGATNINVDHPLYAGFRDALDPSTVNSATFTLSGGPYGHVPGLITYDATNREAAFVPQIRLAYSTTYTASISTAVHAQDGTPLDAGAVWTFTTEADFTLPDPQTLFPPHGALHVPRNVLIGVAWDRALDVSSITSNTFAVAKLHGAAVNGSVAYDPAAQTTTFMPDALLASYTTYVVTLTAGISDTQGSATITPTVWAFTTGDTQPSLAFTGNFVDRGEDADLDGLYERLIIRVGVQMTATGEYALHGVLADADGAPITEGVITPSLAAGVHVLDLPFDGAAIGGHGADGPYVLADVSLVRTDGIVSPTVPSPITLYDAYRTFAYPVAHFPAPLRFDGLPDVLITPGTASAPETAIDAFNVRDYAQHATLASDALSYTVLLNTQPRMGVTLQPSGVLHISPEPYWSGATHVTLQASDGVYMVQDTFEVAIGWPHTIYLPLVLRDYDSTSTVKRNAWLTVLKDDFESETLDWRLYSSIMWPPDGPGGWYGWDARNCRAYSGQVSAWPYGGNEDGDLLACGAPYPNTLSSTMYKAMPLDLTYVAQGTYTAKVWANLAAGAQVCLNVAVVGSDTCEGDWGPSGDYHGICRSGQTSGWEDLTLDLANVPDLGSVLSEEHVCVAVDFYGGESGTRPEGAYVDDVALRVCPEGLTEYCEGATVTPPATPPLVAGNIGGYAEDVDEVALAVADDGHVYALWTGKLNPNFDDYVFYSDSADGVTWTPYQILNYWGGREPQIAIDNVHHRVHLAYGSDGDGVVHRTVEGGVVSAPTVVAAQRQYYLPDFSLPSGGVAWPSLTVAEDTGTAYLVWKEAYYVRGENGAYPMRYKTWHAYWNSGTWSAPLRKINDQDTQYSTIVATPDGRAMLAWFQRWQQSSGGGTGPGDPIVARTAYGTEPGSFPLRQATHALYDEPQRDDSIVLAYAAGADAFVLASDHAMWPGHSLAYRYVWKDGAWSEPLSVAENTSGRATPLYIGAAADSSLIRYVYSDEDSQLEMRTETDGVLAPAQSVADYLSALGYTNSGWPLAYFTDAVGDLHMVVQAEKDGAAGFYYVEP